jgi:hypothetical protein
MLQNSSGGLHLHCLFVSLPGVTLSPTPPHKLEAQILSSAALFFLAVSPQSAWDGHKFYMNSLTEPLLF